MRQDENMVLFPDTIKDLMRSALTNTTAFCKLQVKQKDKLFCQNSEQRKMEAQDLVGMGLTYSTFKAGLLASEFDVSPVTEDLRMQEVASGKLFEESGIGPFVLQSLGALSSRAADSFDYTADSKDNLVKAFGGDSAQATQLLNKRREIIDDTLKKVEALIAAVTTPTWYDCTKEVGLRMCISSDTSLLSAANFHDDLRSGANDEDVRRVNGNMEADPEQGCLWLGIPTGTFNCRWHLHDGIEQEAERVRRLSFLDDMPQQGKYDAAALAGLLPDCRSGHRFTHPISGEELEWSLDCDRVVTAGAAEQATYCVGCPTYNVTSNTDGVVYTAYVRMIGELMNPEPDGRATADRYYKYSDALMRLAPRVFPRPRAIFDLPANGMWDPKGGMPELDLGAMQDADNVIAQFQDCVQGVETASYETCSDELLGLYDTAAQVRHPLSLSLPLPCFFLLSHADDAPLSRTWTSTCGGTALSLCRTILRWCGTGCTLRTSCHRASLRGRRWIAKGKTCLPGGCTTSDPGASRGPPSGRFACGTASRCAA